MKDTKKTQIQHITEVIVNACLDYVLYLDRDLRIQWANRFALQSAGMSQEDITGRLCYEIWHYRKKPCSGCPVAKTIETGQPNEGEVSSPEKKWWFIRAYPIRDEMGNITGVAEIAVDTTEQKKTEEALRESEKRFSQIAENTLEFIWEVDTNGLYTYASPVLKKILGYEPEEIVRKKHFYDLFHPEDREETRRQAFEAFDSKRSFREFLNRNIHKNGQTVWLSTSGVPILDEKGNLLGYRGADTDITARTRAEEERKKLQVQIQHTQKLESLGVLAGGIAHDFNNLLMGMLGHASLALIELPPELPVRSTVEKIEKAALRAAELTNQMLAYSGKGRFVVQSVDLSGLVEEMAHLLKVSISKKVTLRFDFSEDLPPVEADATQLRQVIMNLITNASEAIEPENGVVSVATGVIEADRSYLSETYLDKELPEGCYVYLEVSDTGCGMDAETRANIFDPFFTTKFTGRGLGLAAVLGIVRGHRGVIKVYSEQGKGTTIKILFPCTPQPPRDAGKIPSSQPDAAKATGDGKTVLVVDDEETVRQVARSILESRGFVVLAASDGREGVDLFSRESDRIALVLLDTTMPNMGGEEAFREMRRLRRDVRVILTSGYNEQDVTSRFTGMGPAGFIQKPYRATQLIEKINEILGE